METAIQLEFNIEDKSPEELKLFYMQKQLDEMNISMGKVRRKIFSEVSEVKKLYAELLKENEQLKIMIKDLKNEKTRYIYGQGGSLFDVQEYREAIC